MQRTLKIFEEDKIIYERNLSVNTAILRGRICKEPRSFGDTVRFTIQLSNGKNKDTDEWKIPTYADCTAFGDLGSKILKLYHDRDEIFIVGKFYSNTKDDKTYKGFTVREILNIKNENFEEIEKVDEDLPF